MSQLIVEVVDKGSVDKIKAKLRELGVAEDQVTTKAGGMGAGFASMAPIAVGAAAVAAAAVAGITVAIKAFNQVVDFSKRALSEWNLQAGAIAQVESALKSTGGTAGFTSRELQALASSLQKTTAFADDATLSMQSVLLTFTSIRGEIYARTVPAILDVATRMGTDLNSAALQVGKALNDPVKNLGALGRAGIQFSVDQEKAIKTLVETGRLAEAQGIILGELETQFGGAAEAARLAGEGPFLALKNATGDLYEAFGQGLSPAVNEVIGRLTELAEDEETAEMLRDAGAAVGELVEFVGGLTDELSTALPVVIEFAGDGIDLLRATAIVAGERVDALSGFIIEMGEVADAALGPLDEIVASLVKLVGLGEPKTLLKLIQTLAPLGGVLGMVAAHAATTGAEVGELATTLGIAAENEKAWREELEGTGKTLPELERELAELEGTLERTVGTTHDAAAAKKAAAEAAREYKDRVRELLSESKEYREELEGIVEELELEVNLRRVLHQLGGEVDLSRIEPPPSTIPEHEPWVTEDLITEQEEIQREAERVSVEFEFLLARAFDDMSVGDLAGSFASLGEAIGVKMGAGLNEALEAALSALGSMIGSVFDSLINDTEISAESWIGSMGTIIGSIWGPYGAAIGGALGGALGGWIDSGSADAVTGQTEFQVGGTQLGINALEGSVKAINEAFSRIEELVSGTIESTEKIEIKTRANGEVWLRIGEIMNVQVDSVAEALDLATTWLLKTAEFSGVPEQVLQALAHTSATTIEELTRDLALAMDIARLDMGPVRAFFMDLFDKVSREIERAIELGIDPDPLIKKAGDDLLEALRNATTPEEHQQLADEIANQRAQLEAALAAAQAELVRVQGLIQRYLEGTTRLPQAVIDTLMRQAQDIAAQIAGIEAQLGLLPTDIPAFSGGGGGGRRGRREQQERTREGLRDQVEGLERGVLDPFQEELLSLGDIIPDLTAELNDGKLSAAEYADLLARATAAVDAMGQALVDDLIGRIDALAPSAGALTDSLAAIDDQVATLAAELAMLGEAGLMSADAIAEASAALEANAEAARFAQVEQRAQDVLLQALTFLGREEEVARLRFQIDQAGLLVAIAELELAQEKYGLELAIFDQLGGLAAEIAALEFDPSLLSPPTASPPPAFNRLDSAASDAARALEEMQRRLERANESLRDLVDDLSLGEVGAAVSPQQALAFAESRYRDTLARAQAGDLEAREALSGVARDFLDVLGDYSPELLALESPRILAEIQRLLGLGGAPPSALAPSRVLDGGNRFGGGPAVGAAAAAPVIAGQQPAAGLVDLGIVASAQLHTQRAIKASIDNLAEQQRRAIDQNARFLAEAHAEYGARAS
jgi:hypothetical protein